MIKVFRTYYRLKIRRQEHKLQICNGIMAAAPSRHDKHCDSGMHKWVYRMVRIYRAAVFSWFFGPAIPVAAEPIEVRGRSVECE